MFSAWEDYDGIETIKELQAFGGYVRLANRLHSRDTFAATFLSPWSSRATLVGVWRYHRFHSCIARTACCRKSTAICSCSAFHPLYCDSVISDSPITRLGSDFSVWQHVRMDFDSGGVRRLSEVSGRGLARVSRRAYFGVRV